MAVDKNKVIAEATKLVQRGAFDKAIKAYQKILAVEPKEVRILLKVGELHQKKGDNVAAAEIFGRAADVYGEQGFFLKAIAVYKQMMKLAPDDVRVNERLASLYQQLGILSDAMGQLQLVAASAERSGDSAKLLDVLKRMVELEPDNVASAVKLGELYVKASQPKLALDQFRRAAGALLRNNRSDEYVKVAERIAVLTPEDHALTRELAHIYLAKGDTKRALSKLQLCFKADPKDFGTLTLLAQAFKDLGQVQKTVSVYRELGHLHEERGTREEARATWRRLLELAPGDAEALAGASQPRTPATSPAAAPSAIPLATRVAARPAAPPAASAAPQPAPPRPPAPAGAEAIPKLLTETDVYVKYGLHEKALDHLMKVFALDPDHLDAREKALHLRAARNDAAGAAEEAVRVVRIAQARGLEDRAQAALARLRELAPSHPELASLSAGAPPPPPAESDEELAVEVEHPDAEGDHLALSAAGSPTEDVVEDLVDDEPLPVDDADVELDDDEAPEEEDLDDELEEAESFLQQRLFDEARELLRNLLSFYPAHAKLKAKLAQVEARAELRAEPPAWATVPEARTAAPSAPVASPGAAAAADEGFDIAKELAEELGTGPIAPAEDSQYSVADVFSQFKKGVEQTVTAEDADTHYDLGIAYREMGLIDDALHEFEVALAGKGKKKELDCLTMIAICRMEKGDPAGAVQAYQRALRSDLVTPEVARAVNYELGGAYEAAGDPQVGLYYLQKVMKVDPGYRDVRAMVARLGGGPGRAPAPAAAEPPRAAEPDDAARPGNGPGPGKGPGPKKNIGYV